MILLFIRVTHPLNPPPVRGTYFTKFILTLPSGGNVGGGKTGTMGNKYYR